MAASDTPNPAAPAPAAPAMPQPAMPAPAMPAGQPPVPASPTAGMGSLVAYKDADPARKARIESAMKEIDMKDTKSILFFGTKAQQELTTISDQMLEGVRNKDVGPAGAALSDMLSKLRGFKLDDMKPGEKPGLIARMLGALDPIAKFAQQYEDVRKQIDSISDRLETHKGKLLTDIVSLDRLYEANLKYFHDLADYIAAGDEQLRRLDGEIIPAKAKEAEAAPATDSAGILKAQELRDVRQMRDDLERRTHDLKLTRQVAMQGLPSIRLVQENDKSLVSKIESTMLNTIPLWKQQLAQAVTIYRSGQAAKTIKEASDLTNELLKKNAENLRTANAETRTQIERGVVDIETIKFAHAQLIETIEDSLRIADEGKKKRAEAEKELVGLEASLKDKLMQAAARAKAIEGQPAGGAAKA
jgi:uncharacterized protein YaaN involved in tellurite resistance